MPFLSLIVPPVNLVRFRYESEKGSHGGLSGRGAPGCKKAYPTVKLENYNQKRNIIIKVSLYTNEENPRQHVLHLKKKNHENTDGAIYEKLGKDFTAKFQSLSVVNKKKEEILGILRDRKIKELKPHITESEKLKLQKKYEKEIEEDAKIMQSNLNAVRLCFEAFYEDDESIPVCEKLFSDPIYNQKSSVAGELKIHRLSRVSGSWCGGDEVILLCDKVRKEDIQVRFFETNEYGEITWEDFGKFNKADVHYQVAITFKTPAYVNNIEKDVKIQLYRRTDGECSEPRDFKYLPDDDELITVVRKRKKPNPMQNFTVNTENTIPENMSIEAFGTLSTNNNADLSFCNPSAWADVIAQENSSSHQSSEVVDYLDFDANSFNLTLNECLSNTLPPLSNALSGDDYLNDFNAEIFDAVDIDGANSKFSSLSLNDNETANSLGSENAHQKCMRALIACVLQSGDVHALLHSARNIIPLQDEYGNSLLHIAVSSQNDNLEIIQCVLNVISEDIVNLKNKRKETALHLAVHRNKQCVLNLLLKKGGNLNIPNQEGNNCLHLAARNDFILCMEVLLRPFHTTKHSYFPALNALNHEGIAPLHFAVINGSLKCVDLLLRAKANVNVIERKSGQSPLHIAIETKLDIVRRLLEEPEIDVNVVDFRGLTPLQLAYIKMNGDYHEDMEMRNKYPAVDSSKGLEILNVLTRQIATHEDLINIKTSSDDHKNVIKRKQNLDSCTEKKLCQLLDTSLEWKKLGLTLGVDADMLQNMEKFDSYPTKTLLMHIKGNYDNYCETLMESLKIAQLADAIDIINGSSAYTITN